MKIDSPVGRFISFLDKNTEAAKTYHAKLDKNEAATRAVLIDPVIKALGRDITNPDMVEFEKSFQDTRIDYALYGIDRKIKIMLNPKNVKLTNNARNVYKLFSYAFLFEIDRVVLTKSITWQLISSLQPNHRQPDSVHK